MPFPGITIPPETDYRKLLDTLQRFFVSAMPYWKKSVINYGLDVNKPTPSGSATFYYATDTAKLYFDPPT